MGKKVGQGFPPEYIDGSGRFQETVVEESHAILVKPIDHFEHDQEQTPKPLQRAPS